MIRCDDSLGVCRFPIDFEIERWTFFSNNKNGGFLSFISLWLNSLWTLLTVDWLQNNYGFCDKLIELFLKKCFKKDIYKVSLPPSQLFCKMFFHRFLYHYASEDSKIRDISETLFVDNSSLIRLFLRYKRPKPQKFAIFRTFHYSKSQKSNKFSFQYCRKILSFQISRNNAIQIWGQFQNIFFGITIFSPMFQNVLRNSRISTKKKTPELIPES